MSVSNELQNLFTEEPKTWEDSWGATKPDPQDIFWKFRPPSIDPKRDPFGAFQYTQKYVALLDRPLTAPEMVDLYAELLRRKNLEHSNSDAFEAQRILLTIDLMDMVASNVKKTKYSAIAANQLFTDLNFTIDGVKIGDRYREAALMFPGSDWPRTAYVKGMMLVPSVQKEVEMWMGPYKTRWKEVDTSNNRSGILVDFEEGPVYYWFFDEFANAVAAAAENIHFYPTEQITEAQELKITYLLEETKT